MLSASDMLNALPGDKAAIRRYVTSAPSTQLADGSVAVNVTHSNLRQFVQELRFDLHSTIADVKQRLYTFNGSNMGMTELHLKDAAGNLLARMLDDSRMLGYYGVASGMTIHVVDNDPFSLSRDGGLDDVSRIDKYRMTEEDYDKREKTYRNWVRAQKAADPTWVPPHIKKQQEAMAAAGLPVPSPAEAYLDPACVAGVEVGQRCQVEPGARRGEVAYVGTVEGLAAGHWVGVRLDEPLGRNDGSLGGRAYFAAPDKHGAFVRPSALQTGAQFRPLWEEEGLDELAQGQGQGAGAGSGDACGADACCGHEHGSDGSSSAPAAAAAASSTAVATKAAKPKRRGQLDDSDDEL